MDAPDFLYEGVKNSIEAGCTEIDAIVRSSDHIEVTLADNGSAESLACAFEEGVSSRGDGRGKGLFLLKRECPDAELKRADGKTVLSFSFPEQECSWSQTLAFIFSLCQSHGVRFTADMDGRVIRQKEVESRYGNLSNAHALALMKREFGLYDKGVEKE